MRSVGGASVSVAAGAVEVWSIAGSVGWDSVGAGSGVDGMTVVSTAEAVSCIPRVSAVVASWVKVRLMPSVGGASVSVTAGAVDVWSINDLVGWASVGPGSGVDGTVVVSAAEDVSCSPRVSAVVAKCVNVWLMPSVGGASVSVAAGAEEVWSINDSVGWASVALGSGVDGIAVVSAVEAVRCSPRVSAVVASWVKVRLMRSVGGASVWDTAGAVKVWSINDSVGWDSVGAGSGVDGMTVVSTAEAVSCSPRVSAVVASWVKVRLMRSVGGASVSVAAGAVMVWSINDSVGWVSVGPGSHVDGTVVGSDAKAVRCSLRVSAVVASWVKVRLMPSVGGASVSVTAGAVDVRSIKGSVGWDSVGAGSGVDGTVVVSAAEAVSCSPRVSAVVAS